MKKFLLLAFFLIVITGYAKAQPANDNPCNAIGITVGNSCTFTQYSNLNATASPGVPVPGCASYSGGDVWFSAVVPSSGSISFDTNTGGITDGGMAIYTGTCNSLTLLGCNDDGSANGLMPSLTETGLTPGSTVFIRVWEYGNDNNGTFSICASAGPTCSGSNSNATCATASPFCTGVSYDYCNTTGISSIGGSGIYDCLLTAPNPAFFFMNIATSGPVTFNISQQTFGGVGIDVDFVLWGPFASQGAVCSGISAANAIDCSYSTAAVETASIPNALAGQWYMILITNFSDQNGVINFSQTNSGNPGAGVTNCNIVTATPGICAAGFYTLAGAVTVPAPPASGTLTITNSCGGSQVINAPFTSPVNYSIPNICGNGNNCSVTAVFSAAGSPVVLPTSYTAPSCNTLTATPGACVVGGYGLTGSLTTGCLPTTGTLTITSSCGGSVVFNAPFSSPLAWSLPVSNGTGGNCTVTAVYSAAGAPIITPFTFTEPSCCGSDAGTVTTTHTNGTQTVLPNGTTQVVLCPGGTVKLNSSNDFILPGAGCIGCTPGLMYAIYAGTGPTVPDPDADPNWTGYFWTGENFNTANSGGLNTNSSGSCSPLLNLTAIPGFASPNSPTNTLIFVPITADATNLPNHDANNDGCFDIGNPIAITFLNPVSFNPTPGCNGSVSVNITGGYPQFFPAFYTLTNTGAGTLTSTTVSSGGNAIISGLTPGQSYSFTVNDGNGCTATFSGVYSGNPTVSILPASSTVCTATCVNLVANVTSGVGPGNQTFTSNQCATIPDGGIGAANNPPTVANAANWAHTSISVSGVCAPAWNTGDNLTVCLNISHTFVADLDIYLQAPNGVYYLLSDDNGGLGVNYTGTCFSATAATLITAGTAPFSAGPYKPEGAGNNFAGLSGTPINGSWSLWVADDAALDAGTLNNWSITFTNQNTYTYSWAPAAGLSATNILNPTACPASTTTYTLTVTNSCGCPATANTTVTVTSSVTPTFNAIAAICSGDPAPVLPTTSTNGITGTWVPAVSNTTTGTYTFTPDAGQCATTATLTVTVNPLITPTFNAIVAICSSDPAPVLSTTSINGITGTWAPAVSNTTTGTYTFTPDAGQCATTPTLTVTVNPLITPTFNAIAAICSGDPVPVLPTTSTNGITGTWAPAVSNTTTGTYTFTPDAGQCAVITTLTVTVNPLITPTFNAIAAICSGDPTPVLPTTSTNGITGTWAPAVSNTTTGTYTFTPDAGQCAVITTLTVTVNPLITPIFNAIAAICSGDPAPVLPTTSTNGITGTWAPAVSNTTTGTYTFTPDAGQCAVTKTLTVTVNPLITPTFNAIATICSGDPAPVLPTTSTNGITGTWVPGTVDNSVSANYTFVPDAGQCATSATLAVTVNPLITPTFAAVAAICPGDAAPVLPTTSINGITGTWAPAVSNTTTGTYTFTPDAGQCTVITTLTVTVNPLITPTFNAIAAICAGDAVPVFPTTSTNGITGTWAPAASNTTTGTYTFTPDAGQCATTTTLIVTVNPLITPTFNAIAAICSGDPAPVLPTTSTNGITGTWTPAVSNTTTGTYTFTPDAGQCAVITTLTVTVNPLITPTFNAIAAICSGDPAPVLPTTSTNGITGTWAPAVSNTTTGTYTFTPDAGQCATTTTLTVTVNPLITPTFNAIAAICSGDPVPVFPTTSTNGITGTWAPAVSNTTTGTYTFTPDAGQCAVITTLTVTVNPLITPTFNAIAAICSGDPAPVLPTTSTNGITGTWAPAVSNTTTGTYTFTPDAGQCATTTTLTVTVNPLITPTFNAIAAICSGDPAPVLPTTSTNGITGTWAPAVSNTTTGTYTFTPDAGQCATTTTLTVTVNPLITSTFNAVAAICSGDPAPVLPTTSTNGITGTWAPAVSNTTTGTYTFTPDAGQCAVITTLTVTVNPLMTPSFNAIAAICSGDPALVLPTTSTNGITGTWAPAVSNTITGTYTFTPDAGQCAKTTTLIVTVNPLITPTFNAIAAICSGDPAPVLPTTSTNGITGTWAPAVSNTITGTYTFTPDAGQCATTTTLIVTVNPLITPTFNAIAAICSGDPAPVLPTTSTNGITGTWAPAVSNTTTGTYTFTPDAGQCATTTTLTVTVNLLITPTFNAVAAICSGDPVPVLSATSTNGIAGTWAPAVSNTTTGTYTFTPDAGQCATTTTLIVTVNPLITPTFNAIAAICSGDPAPVLPTTSTNGITGTWAPAVSNTTTGTYTFTPDAGQCATTIPLTITVNPIATSTTNSTICSNLLPYNWNGNNYPGGGTYSVTLVSATSCDSIATLNLAINPTVTSTTNTSICINQLPYSWNSNNYPTAGTYSITLVTTAGCDSIATLNLVVNPIVTSSTNITICTNQLPYNWNGNSYVTAGTYTFTLTSSEGCDSIATLNLTVNSFVGSTTDITICNNQLPYSWNSNSYLTAGTYSVTLTSTTGCDSIATLNLTANAVVTSTTDIAICNNQLPYSWNGNNYPAGGTYMVTLTSGSGCDSIATLNLTANAAVTSTTDIAICTNQLPYTWNGNNYPTAGTYLVTLISTAGCDSIATLNLTANAAVTSTTDIAICNNQLPYSWNGNNYPTAGTYSVTLISTAGCDSIATLNLVVNPVVTSSTNITICTNQLPYNWNSNSYVTAGTYAVTLTSSEGCDSIATLNLTVNSFVGSTTDITICNNQLPYSWNSNSYPTAGTYSVTLTSSTGCDSIATLNLTANAVVTSITDIAICTNQFPYNWNGNSYPAAGNYTVTLTSGSGCDSIATLNLTANAAVTSTTAIAICTNQLPYSWNGNNYPTAGTYLVTLISTAGCDSIATLNLTANAAVISTTDIAICNNQLPYSWNGNSYPAGGTYTVTLTSGSGCDSIATLNLTANAAVTSTTAIAICTNQLPYSWNGNNYPTAGTYSVTLISTAGCDSIATLNLTANAAVTSTTDIGICNNQLPYSWNGNNYPTAGTYSVTLISTAGCDSIATLNLVVNPVVTSSTNITICTNQLPYNWNSNSYVTAGTYAVTLTSSEGCDSIATLNLTVNSFVGSTTDITICNNQLPYSWNSNSYPTAGTYSVTLTSSTGCDSIATLNLTANAVVTSITDIAICTNQFPYNWNGNSYPAGGTYTVTLTSGSGCDSIATLNLTANAAVTSTTAIAICTNQLPYSWNGNNYPTAGTYLVTLISTAGCDSIATLNLTANAAVTSTTDIAICNNQLPYSWNGNNYPTAGTYSVTLISTAGCDSIATLNLVVNPVVTSSTNITICTNQLPYNWNGNNYSTAGTYSVTLISTAGCDSIATLNLTANDVVTSTTDIAICNNQLPYSWNGNSYPAAGTYTVTLTSGSGCDSIATLNLTANAVVTSTTDIAICTNQLPYSWNGNNYPTAGTYSVTLISTAGCDSIATLNLVVNPVVPSSTNITICTNQLPYNWNGNNYSTAGTYSVTLISTAGCDSIATLNLTANDVVTSTTDIAICNNQLPYSWNGNSYPAAGTYTVTLTSGSGCDSIATLNLTANAVVTSTTDIAICTNQLPYSWNGNNYPTAGTYTVTLTSGSGCDSIATLNLTANAAVTSTTAIAICTNQLPYSWNGNSYPAAGTYTVTLTSGSGCDSIATLNLTANAAVTSTTAIAICTNQLPYSWNGNSYPAAGNFTVTLVSNSGCDSIATLNLAVSPAVTSITNTAICTNQLPYSWNSNNYPTAGTYSITLVTTAGCDSIATLNLVVNPVVTSSTNITICTNQLPYNWNSNSYVTAGTYAVTLTSSEGCDSIATLNLTVNSFVGSTTDITICNNQLPYSWNSNSYLTAGTYSVTLTSTTGCDSIATLNLTANAVVTSTTDIAICNNQLPYSWNGNNYPAGGTYMVTLTSGSGCDSIATLNLTANAAVTSTTDIAICTNQLPYTWNGNNYPTAGTYLVTLISTAGCDSIATLNLTANAAVTSTTDIAICNNQLPYSWNGNSYPAGGTYTVTLTSGSGCDSIATLNLTANAAVTSTTAIAICTNQLPYSWNGNNYPTAGTYSVTLISTAGCDSIATLNLTANAVVTSTTDIAICNNQLPYSWNGNNYPAGGTYMVTLTSGSGCDSIATLNLTANAAVTSTTAIAICTNQLPYSWNGNSYSAAGTYTVTLTSGSGCDSIATLNLTANDVVTSTTDIAICTNQLPYSWNGNNYSAAGTYTVTLTSGSGCDSIATLNLTANAAVTSTTAIAICTNQLPYSWNGNSYSAAGTYTVTLTSGSGCDSIATLNLTANDVVTSTTDIAICTNQLPYSWNGNNYSAAGTYTVTFTSGSGCDSIATLNLTANDVVTSTTDIAICTNQLPYSWNGNNYSAAGTYTVTLTSGSGCDSIATLNLTANAVVTSTTDIAICTNQLPYSWNGNNYSTAGTYSVTLISTAGCDSIATLNLTANAAVTSTTAIAICTNQLPYSWNGNNYSTAGTYSVTLISTAGCDSIATLNLTANDVVTSTTDIAICNNQLPYSWNGNSYPAAGTYTVTLTSGSGCDSIATLNLTANAVVTSTTDIAICTNQLPYSWNGNSYTASGIYSVTLVSAAGCDSVAILNLVASNVVTSNTTVTICSTQLPYSWNGNTYPASGTYSVTLTSSGGCDSIASLYLVSNAVATSNTNTTICSTQLPYNWNGNNYTAPGIYTTTLVSTMGCDSIATLQLLVNNATTSSTNVTVCSNQLPYAWNGQNYATGGVHIITLVNTAGCDSVATLNLNVLPGTTSTNPVSTCSNQLPYSWNGQNYSTAGSHSVTLINAAGCDSIATLLLSINIVSTSSTVENSCTNLLPYNWNGQSYSTPGTHTVTLTSSTGCDSVATLQLTINPVVTSTTNAATCDNQFPYSWNGINYPGAGTYSVTLTSTSGCDSIATLHLVSNALTASLTSISVCSAQLPYSWNGQSYSSAGLHAVTLNSSTNCDSIASLDLIINQTPALPAVDGVISYCEQEATAQLTALVTTAGSQLLWYTSPAGGIGSLTAPTPSSLTAGTQSFYVSQLNGSCEGPRALITVTVTSKPDFVDHVVKLCSGQTANIATLYNTTGLTGNWTFNQQPVANPTSVQDAGSYQLVVANAAGCADTALVTLAINPPVTANAGPDANAEFNQPYQLTGSGGGEYQWSPSTGLNNTFIANPLTTISQDQTYILLVKDEIGCFALDTVNLRVLNGPTFYVPSAFTPNGDGLNDYFRPTAVGIQSLAYFAVFNRYGQLMFEMQDLASKGWDGTYKGKKQSLGNYAWHLKGIDRKGAIKIMKGNCVLIR